MTLVRRGERWGVKVWDPKRKRYSWVGTFATELEARNAERDAELIPKRLMPTVAEWGAIWLSDFAREAPATRLVYRQAVDRIAKDLGPRKLDGVSRLEARQWANAWPRNISAVARTMWNDAKATEVCSTNPWAGLKLKQSRGRKDISAISESELLELAALAGDSEYPDPRAIVLTLGYVGLRPGELCALRWTDLDSRRPLIHVKQSVDSTGREKAPKNGEARTITIPPRALEAIRSLPRSLSDDYVFHTVTGKRFSKASLFYVWRPVRAAWEAAGKPHIDLYELRHAALTFLVERGVSVQDVARQAGHIDGGVLVMERYGHPDEERALDRLLMAYSEAPERPNVRSTEAGAA